MHMVPMEVIRVTIKGMNTMRTVHMETQLTSHLPQQLTEKIDLQCLNISYKTSAFEKRCRSLFQEFVYFC